ncbi:sulfatase family protein [Mariniflexile sp. AS56]|uniref:sulfatase family protein n=1 Tax=Mariniflexile sp. AS56 TaxID=3063957 RepID=UPI0026F0BEDA|nr:arylsulfatase [Mariniflexile sp. AS56]MDO7172462.1 arylsulfatase [Mariniflexile sp. AS56]
MKKNIKILLAILFVVSTSIINAQEKTPKIKSPNIIYILADDLGYGDVQYFNPLGKISTPNLDEMSKNGAVFTDAHTSSSVCTPTRYGILTGRYNWRSKLKKSVLNGYSKSLIKQERITIAEMLKKQGYNTAFIGKWHLGWDWSLKENENVESNIKKVNGNTVDFSKPIQNGPNSHGFDYAFGFCGSLDMPPYVYVENGTPTIVPTKYTKSKGMKMWRNGLTSNDFSHNDVLQNITNKAVNYIDKNAKAEKPFFLYLPLPAPHTPILPTEKFLGKSNTNIYGDFVMQVDDVVRQVREILVQKGISANTLVVFTSDNGCSPKADFKDLATFNHYPSSVFRGYKADIYEGGHRVPFIIEWPAKALKKTSFDNMICTTDFFATCAEITGYKLKDTEGEDSFSMLSLITGENDKDIREYIVHHSIDGMFAIRQGNWKLSFCPGSGGWSDPRPRYIRKNKMDLPPMQLFNLKDDIGETKNLIAEYPKKVIQLKTALKKIILDGRSTPGAVQENDEVEGWSQINSIVN